MNDSILNNTILFLGDSLTAGNIGASYLKYLEALEALEGVSFFNYGENGDAVLGVWNRLEPALKKTKSEMLVLQVGANDILLPEMKRRGGAWEPFLEEMEAKGNIPAEDNDQFVQTYKNIISTAYERGIKQVVSVTVPPLGENLSSDRNQLRTRLNALIGETAHSSGAILADVSAAFESVLSFKAEQSDYFFETPGDVLSDARMARRLGHLDKLSDERGLFLTIDGAHFNTRGAKLAAEVIGRALVYAS